MFVAELISREMNLLQNRKTFQERENVEIAFDCAFDCGGDYPKS